MGSLQECKADLHIALPSEVTQDFRPHVSAEPPFGRMIYRFHGPH